MSSRAKWTLAFCVWLCVVWGHSLMSGPASSFESSRFVFLVRPLFEFFGCTDESVMTFFIRKGAHFTEHAIAVMLGWKAAREWFGESRKALWVTLAIWVLVPCIDEGIQLTVPGRAGMVTDVLIDMSGGLAGMLLMTLIHRARSVRNV